LYLALELEFILKITKLATYSWEMKWIRADIVNLQSRDNGIRRGFIFNILYTAFPNPSFLVNLKFYTQINLFLTYLHPVASRQIIERVPILGVIFWFNILYIAFPNPSFAVNWKFHTLYLFLTYLHPVASRQIIEMVPIVGVIFQFNILYIAFPNPSFLVNLKFYTQINLWKVPIVCSCNHEIMG